MGLKDFISNYKEKRRASSLKRNISRLANKHQLSENRYAAAEWLHSDGSDEAIAGLLKRFGFTYDNSIKDKAEKEYVTKIILSFGERAVPAIKDYINRHENIAWPLRILEKLIPKEDILEFLLSILSEEDATFKDDILEKRLDLLNYLAEFKDPRIVKKTVSFLKDEDEEVRFRAIEVLGEQGDEIAKEPLIEILINDEESARVKMRILEVIMGAGWTVSGFKKKVEETLPEGYYLTREGKIKVRGDFKKVPGTF